MYCEKCGKQIPDDSKFCRFCGETIEEVGSPTSEETNNKRKTVYVGEIHKCPNCGEILDAFVSKCPSCGVEVRGIKNGSTKVEELAEKLQNTNDIEKKKELISNFYVPNTKEDIIEFFTLAVSQIDDDNACSKAWCSKLEQILIKAKLSLGDTEEYKYIVNLYENAKKKKKKETLRKHRKTIIRTAISAVLGIAGIILIIFGVISDNGTTNSDNASFLTSVGILLFLGAAGIWTPVKSKNKSTTNVTTKNNIKKK